MTTDSPARRMWTIPVVLGVLTATGLLSALVSDLWGDVWSWFALGLPVLVMAWYGLRRPAAERRSLPSSPANLPQS